MTFLMAVADQLGKSGGAGGVRTRDLLDAIEARSQLRYGPTECKYCCSFYSTLLTRASNNSLTMESTAKRDLGATQQDLRSYDQNDHATPDVEDVANRWNRRGSAGPLHLARRTPLAGVHPSSLTCRWPSRRS